MKAAERRNRISQLLDEVDGPITARQMAEQFRVSRQLIVGDVALLRAEGREIIATPQGYVSPQQVSTAGFVRQIVCMHDESQTLDELYTIVDLGGKVKDVSVDHPLYGELKGQLNVSSRDDADRFKKNMESYQTEQLSVLTNGIHSHTLLTPDLETYERIVESLDKKGILYKN